MGFGFLNAMMLLGLVGVVLPILAHFISKRRYDVVQWGAMRFLELGQKTRRRFHIQDILLLLFRMALLAVLALALARPWGNARFFSSVVPRPQVDFVFVLDGSGSLGWQDGMGEEEDGKFPPGTLTPYRRAIQWVYDALELLQPGDTAGVVDARNESLRIVSPTTDRSRIRQTLNNRPEPGGTSSIPAALEEAIRMLATASNAARRVIVLTDRQALAWRPEDEAAWMRVSELRKQAAVSPEIDVVFFGESDSSSPNFSVGPVELSRFMTVSGFPIKLRAKIRQSGGQSVARKTVSLVVDGRKVLGAVKMVDILPNGESTVEFDHIFPSTGNYVVSIEIEESDPLPVDNLSSAVVTITESVPVLLVDGDRQADPSRQETFYLRSAFAAAEDQAPWVKARVIRPFELNAESLRGQKIVFLCNVEEFTERQIELLQSFARDGGGIVFAPGDRVSPDFWNQKVFSAGDPFFPARFIEVVDGAVNNSDELIWIDSMLLEAPWLRRFRNEEGGDLTLTRFLKWWRLEPVPSSSPDRQQAPLQGDDQVNRIQVRLSNGDPLLVRHRYGEGEVVQLAIPLDADWSTLPAKNDFVPFLYELVFTLTGDLERRNVQVGEPLLLKLKNDEVASDYVVHGPGISDGVVTSLSRGQSLLAKFDQTWMPGIYRFVKTGVALDRGEPFVVDDDHSESNLTVLTPEEWTALQKEQHLQPRTTMTDIISAVMTDAPKVELWWFLMILVLVLLVGETALTRRMVQGGHAAVDPSPHSDSASEEASH